MCLRDTCRIALQLCIHGASLFCLATGALAAERVANSVLYLTNGDFIRGELQGSQDPKVLNWCSPLFAQPLKFPVSAVSSVHYAGMGPPPKPQGEYRFELVGDDVLYGDLLRWTNDDVELDSPRVGRVHVRRPYIQRFYRLKRTDAVYLGPSGLAGANGTAATPVSRTFRVVYRDDSCFSGTLTRIEDTHLILNCPAVKEPLRLPLAELLSLVSLQFGEHSSAPLVAGKLGRLEMEGVRLKGRLVEGNGRSDTSCLVWHPELAVKASPLLPGVSGRVVYRDALPARAGAPQVGRVEPRWSVQPTSREWPSLRLRGGETIRCDVTHIDERGVRVKTSFSGDRFVPHEKVKSIELVANDAPRLDQTKRDRLLTLPRFQKDSPPTHLICSRNGDFLRGRLVEMDEKRLKVEVRLETRVIPRDRIAQIIWLHADELTGRSIVSGVNRVQAVRKDGDRLTFFVEKVDRQTISGTSDILGACRADLAELDELLFGALIEQAVAKLAYGGWKLHFATEPKFAQSDAFADDGLTGTESPLVGQAAFSFQLEMLDGRNFNLVEHKGRVVVLEFGATWCSPCLQSLPSIEGVAGEFAGQGVELFAVDLEEQPEQVKSALEYHKLKVPVVLDRDGMVAAKYAVTSIPQTVIIDRDGKVARLFVDGGKQTATSLRKALQELSAGKPAAANGR